MYLILFLVGIVLSFAGVLLLRSAVPVVDAGASALFTSGIVAFVGGLILMGLAAVVRVLGRIAERLEIQPLPLPPVAAVNRDDPAPRPARSASAGPAAAATPRQSLLGWFGRAGTASPAVPAPAAPMPSSTASAAPTSRPAADAAPVVDLAVLTRIPEESRAAPIVAPPTVPAPPAATPVPPARPAAAARPVAKSNGTPETTVYKSGVIDGMAYTLFMDGSIEAELPQGRVRFASIDELQKYLTAR